MPYNLNPNISENTLDKSDPLKNQTIRNVFTPLYNITIQAHHSSFSLGLILLDTQQFQFKRTRKKRDWLGAIELPQQDQ